MTYQEIIDSLRDKKNFSLSRFGDGELNCMFGVNGKNCDGHQYYKDLGEALLSVWRDPRGIIAMQRYGFKMWEHRLVDNVWCDADVLHKASMDVKLGELMEALYDRRTILVGPSHLRNFNWLTKFVEVPLKNAWLKRMQIKYEIRRLITKDTVIVYCCGMMAEVLIWELYRKDITQIDAGSVFDPYVGVNSRQYHKKLNI